MPALPLLEALTWYVGPLLAGGVAARLLFTSLAGTYRALFWAMLFSCTRSLGMIALQNDRSLYGWAYVLTAPLLHGLAFWAALEVYKYVFEAYQGLAVLGRRTMILTLAAGLACAATYVFAGLRVPNEPFPILRAVLLLEASAAFTTFFLLLALSVFLLWYPVPLRRNVLIYSLGLCLTTFTVFVAVALRVFAGAEWREMASQLNLIIHDVTLLLWLIWLGARGEKAVERGAIPRAPDDQKRLLEQLETLNLLLKRQDGR